MTIFSLLLAVYNLLLKLYLNQNDISAFTPVAVRDRFECEKEIGCFTNFIVLIEERAAKQKQAMKNRRKAIKKEVTE